jgi:hypothetical protein
MLGLLAQFRIGRLSFSIALRHRWENYETHSDMRRWKEYRLGVCIKPHKYIGTEFFTMPKRLKLFRALTIGCDLIVASVLLEINIGGKKIVPKRIEVS